MSTVLRLCSELCFCVLLVLLTCPPVTHEANRFCSGPKPSVCVHTHPRLSVSIFSQRQRNFCPWLRMQWHRPERRGNRLLWLRQTPLDQQCPRALGEHLPHWHWKREIRGVTIKSREVQSARDSAWLELRLGVYADKNCYKYYPFFYK